jgi:hypothetical protein
MATIKRLCKKFTWQGIELQIVLRDEPYMNAREPLEMKRVIAPNGGVVPDNCWQSGDSLKVIAQKTCWMLDGMAERGDLAAIKHELTRELSK